MSFARQLNTAHDYWLEMAEPDVSEFSLKRSNLRHAFHAAISLFHMADWVFKTHEAQVKAIFTFRDRTGATLAVYDSACFANALEQMQPDFGRIRGVANAAKHLSLRPHDVRPVPNAPSHAANTGVQMGAFQANAFSNSAFNTGHVVLEGDNDQHINFHTVVVSVYEMWKILISQHGW
jgi:hypothetical protein